jgi:hypothetical protein
MIILQNDANWHGAPLLLFQQGGAGGLPSSPSPNAADDEPTYVRMVEASVPYRHNSTNRGRPGMDARL